MKLDALDHPKTHAFASALNISRPTAIGHLELLWAFTGKNSPQGNIGKWPNGAIARACDWIGDPDLFVDALVAVKLLSRDDAHRLLVHDWHEHAPGWVRAKLKTLKFITAGNPVVDGSPPSGGGGSPPGSPPSSTHSSRPSILVQGSVVQGSEAYEDARDAPRGTNRCPELDDVSEHLEWQDTLALYPPGAQRQDLIGAEKAARRLVEEGEATWAQLREGVARYAACVKATDRLVLNPVKFFTDRDKPWSQLWPIPPPKKSFAQAQQDGVTARFLASGT